MIQLLPMLALFALGLASAPTVTAQRTALDRLPPEAEAIRQPFLKAAGSVQAIELPAKGQLRAVACSKTDIWLVCDEILVITVGDVLVRTPEQRKVRQRIPAPKGLLGLTADDRFFYALMQRAVVVMDATTGREVRRIELPDNGNQQPSAIGSHGDELFIAWPDSLMAIHKQTTKLRECPRPRHSSRWLTSDGTSLWRGGALDFAPVATGDAGRVEAQQGSRGLPETFAHCFATFADDKLLFVKNRDAAGKPVIAALLKPERALPAESLQIALHHGANGIRYQVGPKPIATAAKVSRELARIARHPSSMVPGPDGEPKSMPVQLVVHPGVTVAELARAWDMASDAGFPEVHCISHEAVARPAESPPPPPPPPRRKK